MLILINNLKVNDNKIYNFSLLPLRCQLALRDFMDTGVDEHDN